MKKLVFLILIIIAAAAFYQYYLKNNSIHFNPPAPPENLANPASINCKNNGGKTIIRSLGNGAKYGLCDFGDNMICEEWALMRNQCPVGGIKTTGFDNIGQKYCAWLGGKTTAVVNSQCTLPEGNTCSTDDLYAGTCN